MEKPCWLQFALHSCPSALRAQRCHAPWLGHACPRGHCLSPSHGHGAFAPLRRGTSCFPQMETQAGPPPLYGPRQRGAARPPRLSQPRGGSSPAGGSAGTAFLGYVCLVELCCGQELPKSRFLL